MNASISVMEGTSNCDIQFHLRTGVESSILAGDAQFSPRIVFRPIARAWRANGILTEMLNLNTSVVA